MGPILLVGGEDFDGNLTQTTNVSSTWLFDPASKIWTSKEQEAEVEDKIKRCLPSHKYRLSSAPLNLSVTESESASNTSGPDILQ